MMQPLMFDEFESLAENAKRVAIFQEIPAGNLTPDTIYAIVSQSLADHGMMFEDLQQREGQRYSFMCFEPAYTLSINNNDLRHPLTALRELQSQLSFTTRNEAAELITSAAGFVTYDAARIFENIPNHHTPDNDLPILLFNFYNLSLTYNHEEKSILISYIVDTSNNHLHAFKLGNEKISTIIDLLFKSTLDIESLPQLHPAAPINVDISDLDFIKMIFRAKEYITQGDAFQIVLSRCFTRNYTISPFAIYQSLRQVSPSPFMFYMPTEHGVIIGASPERLVRVNQQKITVNPIAGTRQRTGESTDEAIQDDLLSDLKEVAEHMMLVDLARNDVGAVSKAGSVQVTELLRVSHYSHVSHITSTVTGILHEKYDGFDAFAAAFPAGTLSGAPKIRAMEIINELEPTSRGLYGGAICRLDALGYLDSCIAIRMATLKDGRAVIRTGAGIVFDSDPAKEAEETRQKASSLLNAIALAHGESYAVNY